jgi:ankyrin repeat protein
MGWFGTKQERLDKKLWRACADGKLNKAEQLLAEGANMNFKGSESWSLLHIAAYRSQTEIMKLLISKNADVRVADKNGMTLLMLSCLYGRKITTEFLLQQNCDVAAKNNEGVTALHYAAEQGWESVVQKLLEKGADVHAKTNSGRTALHSAAACGKFNVVTILLENGADAKALDNAGNKPESLARINNRHGVADFLRDKTAPAPVVVEVKDGWQLTAPDEIAFTSEKSGTGYCLTEIFNFTSRIYNRIARNLTTNAESQTIRFFDEFPDKTILENAYQMLARQGGKADSAAIYGTVLNKKPLQ